MSVFFAFLYVQIANLSNNYIAHFRVRSLLTENTYYIYSGFFYEGWHDRKYFQQSQNRCSRERFLSRHGGRVLLVSGFGQGEICCCNKGKYLELRTLDCELGTTRVAGRPLTSPESESRYTWTRPIMDIFILRRKSARV